MLRCFNDIFEELKKHEPVTISVAAAQDEDVLLAVKAAYDKGIAKAILVGDAPAIKLLAEEINLPADMQIINEPDNSKAAQKAVSLVRNGDAQVLLKGLLNSSDYLKAVLNAETGLRTGRLISNMSAYEVPGGNKLIFITDGGLNIAPNLEEKKDILANALEALEVIGIDAPKVAVLAANELVNPKMPATVDAKALSDYYAADRNFNGIVEGPISMDVALSAQAAHHKGLDSKIAGDVDVFLVPTIEVGNILSKALIHYAGFKLAGLVLGAKRPVILVSRADEAEVKLNSIALACLLVAESKD